MQLLVQQQSNQPQPQPQQQQHHQQPQQQPQLQQRQALTAADPFSGCPLVPQRIGSRESAARIAHRQLPPPPTEEDIAIMLSTNDERSRPPSPDLRVRGADEIDKATMEETDVHHHHGVDVEPSATATSGGESLLPSLAAVLFGHSATVSAVSVHHHTGSGSNPPPIAHHTAARPRRRQLCGHCPILDAIGPAALTAEQLRLLHQQEEEEEGGEKGPYCPRRHDSTSKLPCGEGDGNGAKAAFVDAEALLGLLPFPLFPPFREAFLKMDLCFSIPPQMLRAPPSPTSTGEISPMLVLVNRSLHRTRAPVLFPLPNADSLQPPRDRSRLCEPTERDIIRFQRRTSEHHSDVVTLRWSDVHRLRVSVAVFEHLLGGDDEQQQQQQANAAWSAVPMPPSPPAESLLSLLHRHARACRRRWDQQEWEERQQKERPSRQPQPQKQSAEAQPESGGGPPTVAADQEEGTMMVADGCDNWSDDDDEFGERLKSEKRRRTDAAAGREGNHPASAAEATSTGEAATTNQMEPLFPNLSDPSSFDWAAQPMQAAAEWGSVVNLVLDGCPTEGEKEVRTRRKRGGKKHRLQRKK